MKQDTYSILSLSQPKNKNIQLTLGMPPKAMAVFGT